MAATGIAGALYDPDATQATGALSTGIGWGTNAVMGPSNGSVTPNAAAPDRNFTDGQACNAIRIGGASQALNAIGQTAGKAISVEQNTNAAGGAAIANGAAMSGTTSLNKSGLACPPGGFVCAVAP